MPEAIPPRSPPEVTFCFPIPLLRQFSQFMDIVFGSCRELVAIVLVRPNVAPDSPVSSQSAADFTAASAERSAKSLGERQGRLPSVLRGPSTLTAGPQRADSIGP